MKTILMPTDFSKTANNAADYAVEIAKLTNAKVILMHVFHLPMVASDIPVVMPSIDELERNSMKQLTACEKTLHAKHGKNILIEKKAVLGFVIDEVSDIVSSKKVDLIVMGITGDGKLSELIGTNATGVIKNVDCPTLIVPQNAKYKKVHNVALACDYEEISDSPAIKKIKMFLGIFKANLMIFNVVEPTAKPVFETAYSETKIKNVFENIKYSVYFPENDDLVFGINDFVDKHNVDMLIMIPQKHNFLAHLFQQTNTKKVAFHTHVPLLAIHE